MTHDLLPPCVKDAQTVVDFKRKGKKLLLEGWFYTVKEFTNVHI